MQSLLNPKIVFDDSFSLRLADRRATARTTNFVEPCSFQQKKGFGLGFLFLFVSLVLQVVGDVLFFQPRVLDD